MNAAIEKRRLRVGMLTLVLAGLFSLIVIRIAVLLALDGTRLSSLARGEHSEQVTLTAPRGPIVDRHGEALALSAQAFSVYARPARLFRIEQPRGRAVDWPGRWALRRPTWPPSWPGRRTLCGWPGASAAPRPTRSKGWVWKASK